MSETIMANKAIFFDRDDTLIEDPGYISNPDQVSLLENVPETLSILKGMGYKLVVVSNQSGVARGIFTEETLGRIHKRLEQLLTEKGASLDRIYYCPYHPEGVIPKYRRESEMRKPNPGMLLAAGKDLDIDLKESWMVGNGVRDIEAGARAGCKTILLDSRGHPQKIQPGERMPDYRAVNLKEVVNIIKMNIRSPHKTPVVAAPVVEPAPKPAAEPQQEIEPKQLQQAPEPAPQAVVVQEQPAAVEQPPVKQPEQTKPVEEATTQQLLTEIRDQLKSMRRTGMFGEFSISRFFAGVIQGLVGLCVLVSIYFLTSPTEKLNVVLISLGFGILLQLIALTLYTMQGPR
ncbi:MAG: HAD-IIIA family hydrolase [Sedimentisphaerales bacterium]